VRFEKEYIDLAIARVHGVKMVCPFPKPSTLPDPGCTCKSVYDRKYSIHSIFTRSKLISAATSRVGESKYYPGVFFNNEGIYQETNLIYFPLRRFSGQPEKQFGCSGTGTNVPDTRRVVLHRDTKAFVGVMEHPGETGCPEGHKGCFKPCTVYKSVKPAATGITGNRDAVLPQVVEAIPTPAAFRANVPNRNGQLPMQVDAVVKDQFDNTPGLISTNEIKDVKCPVGQ
jgi:hypothetical protein